MIRSRLLRNAKKSQRRVKVSRRVNAKKKTQQSLYSDGGGDYDIIVYNSELLPYMEYNEITIFGIYSFLMSVNGISKKAITEDASYFNNTIVKVELNEEVVKGPTVKIYYLNNNNELRLSEWSKNTDETINNKLSTKLRDVVKARVEEDRTRTTEDVIQFSKDARLSEEIEVFEVSENKIITMTRENMMKKLADSIATLEDALKTETDTETKKKIVEDLEKAKKKQNANRATLLNDSRPIRVSDDISDYEKNKATISSVEISDKLDTDILDELKRIAKTKVNSVIQTVLDRYTTYVEHYTMLSELLPKLEKKLLKKELTIESKSEKIKTLEERKTEREKTTLNFLKERLPRLNIKYESDYMKTWDAAIEETEKTLKNWGDTELKAEKAMRDSDSDDEDTKTRVQDGVRKPEAYGQKKTKTYGQDLVINVLLSTAYILGVKNSKLFNSSIPPLVLNNDNASIYYENKDEKQQMRISWGIFDKSLFVTPEIANELMKDGLKYIKKTRKGVNEIVINTTNFIKLEIYKWNKSNYEQFEEYLWRTSRRMYIHTVAILAKQINSSINYRNVISIYGRRILIGLILASLSGVAHNDTKYPKVELDDVGNAVGIDSSLYVPKFYQIACTDSVLNSIPIIESDFTKGLKLDCEVYGLQQELKDSRYARYVNAYNITTNSGGILEYLQEEAQKKQLEIDLNNNLDKESKLNEEQLNEELDVLQKLVTTQTKLNEKSIEWLDFRKKAIADEYRRIMLAKDAATLKSKLASERIAELDKTIALQKADLTKTNKTIAGLKSDLTKTNKTIEGLKSDFEEFEARAEETKGNLAELKLNFEARAEETKGNLAKSEQEKSELKQENSDLEDDIRLLNERLEAHVAYANQSALQVAKEFIINPIITFVNTWIYSIKDEPLKTVERAVNDAHKDYINQAMAVDTLKFQKASLYSIENKQKDKTRALSFSTIQREWLALMYIEELEKLDKELRVIKADLASVGLTGEEKLALFDKEKRLDYINNYSDIYNKLYKIIHIKLKYIDLLRETAPGVFSLREDHTWHPPQLPPQLPQLENVTKEYTSIKKLIHERYVKHQQQHDKLPKSDPEPEPETTWNWLKKGLGFDGSKPKLPPTRHSKRLQNRSPKNSRPTRVKSRRRWVYRRNTHHSLQYL